MTATLFVGQVLGQLITSPTQLLFRLLTTKCCHCVTDGSVVVRVARSVVYIELWEYWNIDTYRYVIMFFC